MASNRCPREAEMVRAAWGQSGPPSKGETCGASLPLCDVNLASHVAECHVCAEIAALAAAFRDERNTAVAAAHPPSGGLVWWRAERRAREEALRKATNAISVIHAIALGCAAAALVAILGLGLGPARDYLIRWSRAVAWSAVPTSLTSTFSALPLAVLVLVGATLLLLPVALYVALSERPD